MGHIFDLIIWSRPPWIIHTLLKMAKPSWGNNRGQVGGEREGGERDGLMKVWDDNRQRMWVVMQWTTSGKWLVHFWCFYQFLHVKPLGSLNDVFLKRKWVEWAQYSSLFLNSSILLLEAPCWVNRYLACKFFLKCWPMKYKFICYIAA